ncbi:MAG: hypothetical protein ACFB9N_01930 [Geitlerinemataceae cyanobacterium]
MGIPNLSDLSAIVGGEDGSIDRGALTIPPQRADRRAAWMPVAPS